MKWLIDQMMIEREYGGNIYETLLNSGREVSVIEYIPFIKEVKDKSFDSQHLIYGSLELVEQLKNNSNVASFGPTSKFDFNYYSSLLPSQFFMSSDYIIATTSWFEDPIKKQQLREMFGDQVFVRPNTGFKLFSGKVVDLDDPKELEYMYKFGSATSKTIVIISSVVNVIEEYRFFVSKENGVLTGSTYSASERGKEESDYSQSISDFAELVMNSFSETIDDLIVIDVAKYLDKRGNEKLGLVEINCASCSGLYACDALPIIQEMENIIENENTLE